MHDCIHLDVLREWLETGEGSQDENAREFVKKIRALEYVGVRGDSFVFVERVVKPKARLVKFKVIDPLLIMENLHS